MLSRGGQVMAARRVGQGCALMVGIAVRRAARAGVEINKRQAFLNPWIWIMITMKMDLVLGAKKRIVKKRSRRSSRPKPALVGQRASTIKRVKLPDKEQYNPSLPFSSMRLRVWARKAV
jgi:hypothetical protein